VREFAAHHLQYQSLLSVAKVGAGNTLLESEVKAATRDMCEQVPTWPKKGNPGEISLCWIWEIIARTETECQGRQAVWWPDIIVALVTRAMLKDVPLDPQIQQEAVMGVEALQRSTARGFFPEAAILNAERGILLVEDEVLAMPEVQEQCAHFQVITVVSRGNHYVNYYRRERQCTAALINNREPADTQWTTDWLTDLQKVRPLRDTNRTRKHMEAYEAAPPSPTLVTYSNPQKVRFAVFSNSPDQWKYQDVNTAWRRIFHPGSQEAQKESSKGEQGSAHGQPRGQKRTRAAGSEPKPGSRNSSKLRKLDDQTVLESGDTKAVSHWSDPTGTRKVGKGRGNQGGQGQRKGRKSKIKRSQPDQIQSDHTSNQKSQGETKSNANGMGTASEHSEKLTEGVTTADTKERKGTKRKQERPDRGKVLKSRMLGLQTVPAEMNGNCDWLVQRPGVRTRAMCRREEGAKDMLLSTQDTAGDSGPRGIG
jgi:hypothetical protein